MTQEEEPKVSLGSVLDKVMVTAGEAQAFLGQFTSDTDKYPGLATAMHAAIAELSTPEEKTETSTEPTTTSY